MGNNYFHSASVSPPGVYLIKDGRVMSYNRAEKKWAEEVGRYIVRVPMGGPPGVTTICACGTRGEAENRFIEHCPDHKGKVPYYEVINYVSGRKKRR